VSDDTATEAGGEELKESATSKQQYNSPQQLVFGALVFLVASVIFSLGYIDTQSFDNIIVVGSIFVGYIALIAMATSFDLVRKSAFKFIGAYLGVITKGLEVAIGVQNERRDSPDIEKIMRRFDDLVARERSVEKPLSTEGEKEVVAAYISAINSQIGVELRYLFDESLKREVSKDLRSSAIRYLRMSEKRLRDASSTVTARGFLNLIIGIGFAVSALYFLHRAIEDFSTFDVAGNPEKAVAFIAIRLSLTLLVTAISYFFLSLYRTSLRDVRYYNNEITNISFRSVALALLGDYGKDDTLQKVVEKLITEDRNVETTEPSSTDTSSEVIKALIDKIPSITAR